MRQRVKSGLCDTFIKLKACQQDTDEYFCRIKMATQCLKITLCTADLSGSATPLEYKHPHSLVHFDSGLEKPHFLAREHILYGFQSVMHSIEYTFEFEVEMILIY